MVRCAKLKDILVYGIHRSPHEVEFIARLKRYVGRFVSFNKSSSSSQPNDCTSFEIYVGGRNKTKHSVRRDGRSKCYKKKRPQRVGDSESESPRRGASRPNNRCTVSAFHSTRSF